MESPEKFVMQWRAEIEKTRAMGNMEKMREEAISENLNKMFKEGTERKYFAIIEYEFNNEVKENKLCVIKKSRENNVYFTAFTS